MCEIKLEKTLLAQIRLENKTKNKPENSVDLIKLESRRQSLGTWMAKKYPPEPKVRGASPWEHGWPKNYPPEPKVRGASPWGHGWPQKYPPEPKVRGANPWGHGWPKWEAPVPGDMDGQEYI
ncbi:uncharacterized protein F5891DRAFT_975342 [Suillus fuscotomentosus]|uniref:Uncharacterized protein n=1 Tax=Suillus fuscotomentosus TaxID=1912939 RepID=A0AAD4HRY6_9AGAM|nr:uncharacterized protein F5891DRAFT_975342 [Suillus fuscotomentosus]KAG1906567.1 hypothetical protein F5891DRAFT_975342 [Suillus fuscotomentosus]